VVAEKVLLYDNYKGDIKIHKIMKKRRIPLKNIKQLLSLELNDFERRFVTSVMRAQKEYPQITSRMYDSFWNIYQKHFYTVDNL
jgi:hypothetical protein